MKPSIKTLSMLAVFLLLQACGGSMLDEKQDTNKMVPDPVIDDGSDRPRPSENAPVLKVSDDQIQSSTGQPLLMRGVNLQYGDDPFVRFDGINAISDLGSNTIRIQVRENTTAAELETALVRAVQQNMIAVVSLWEPEGKLHCTEDDTFIHKAMSELWMDRWLSVLVQDRFQPYLMINIASGWGPKSIFDGYSTGYRSWADTYKAFIRQFRNAGFKVPLVIDAPGCGQDFHAFLSNRGRELLAADDQKNLVLSVHGYGSRWNSNEKLTAAINDLRAQKMPILMSEFGGSDVGEAPVKHLAIMEKAAGDQAIELDIPWQTSSDKLGYMVTLQEPVDVTNRILSLDLWADEAYVTDGTLGMQVYLRDANNNYAHLGWNGAGALTTDAWNKLSLTIKDRSSFGWANDEFDLTQVTKVGVEFVANGKSPEVVGKFMIDNIKLIENQGAQEVYRNGFDDGIEGWSVPWTGTQIAHQDGALALTRDDNREIVAQLNGLSGVDFSQPVQIAARVFIPADYAGSWLYFKFFSNEGEWRQTVDLGGGDFNYGEWTEIALPAEFAGTSHIGIQAGNIGMADGASITDSTAPILLDDLVILGAAAGGDMEFGQQYHATFDSDAEGFAFLSWSTVSANVSQGEGALVITPTPGSDVNRVVVQKNDWSSVDKLNLMDPFIIKTRVFFPESYAGTEFEFKIFMQDVNWSNHFDVQVWTQEDLVVGEWNELEIEVQFPEGFSREGTPKHFGFEFGGNSSPDTVKVDDFEIWGMVAQEVEEEVVLLVDFYYPWHVQNLGTDIAEGGLTPSSMDERVTLKELFKPFGWIAWSWIGNSEENAAWDLSFSESNALDLTPRGEEIVFGKGGIQETSVPAYPAAVE